MKVLAEKMEPSNQGMSYSERRSREISVLATLDFTSERKAMSSVVTNYKNSKDILLKGAPDRIIEKCTGFYSITHPDTPAELSQSTKQKILDNVAKLSSEGLRCLALAEIPNGGKLSNLNENN